MGELALLQKVVNDKADADGKRDQSGGGHDEHIHRGRKKLREGIQQQTAERRPEWQTAQ